MSSLWPFGSKDQPQAAESVEQGGQQAATPPMAKVRPAPEQENPLAPKHKNPFAQPQAADQAKPEEQPQAETQAAPKAPETAQAAQQPPQAEAPKAPTAKEQAKAAQEAQASKKGATATIQPQPAWKAEQFKDATGTVPAAVSRSMEGGPVALVIKRGGPDCHRLSLNVLLPSKMSSVSTDGQSYNVSMSVDEAQEINLVAKVDGFGGGLVTLKLLPRGNDAALLLSQMQDGKVVRLTTIFDAKALERHFNLDGFVEAMRASGDLCGGAAKKP